MPFVNVAPAALTLTFAEVALKAVPPSVPVPPVPPEDVAPSPDPVVLVSSEGETSPPDPVPPVPLDDASPGLAAAPPVMVTVGVTVPNPEPVAPPPVAAPAPAPAPAPKPRRKGYLYPLRPLGEYDPNKLLMGNQFGQVGYVMDMWGELILDAQPQSAWFWQNFAAFLERNKMPGVSTEFKSLEATGFWSQSRTMYFLQKAPVTVTIYLASFGNDLYMSYRTFLQGAIDQIRVSMFVIAAYIIHWIFINIRSGTIFGGRGTTYWLDILWLVIALVVVFGFASFWAYVNRNGDYLYLYRQEVNELHFDDAVAMTSLVHKGLLNAANATGIETKTLETHEPFYLPKNRAKLRF